MSWAKLMYRTQLDDGAFMLCRCGKKPSKAHAQHQRSKEKRVGVEGGGGGGGGGRVRGGQGEGGGECSTTYFQVF